MLAGRSSQFLTFLYQDYTIHSVTTNDSSRKNIKLSFIVQTNTGWVAQTAKWRAYSVGPTGHWAPGIIGKIANLMGNMIKTVCCWKHQRNGKKTIVMMTRCTSAWAHRVSLVISIEAYLRILLWTFWVNAMKEIWPNIITGSTNWKCYSSL